MTGGGEIFAPWWGRALESVNLRYAGRILEAASEIERAVARGEANIPLDRLVNAHTRERRMGKNDRAVLALAVYGFARNRDTLLSALGPVAEGVPGRLLIAALLNELPPERRAEEPGLLSSCDDITERMDALRPAWVDEIRHHAALDPASIPESARESFARLFSVPAFWLDAGPWATLGEAARELAAGRAPQHPQLRVNATRATREGVLASLGEDGIEAEETQRSPWGLVLQGRVNLGRSRAVQEGLAEVQDEGSQLLAFASLGDGVRRALDLCAGAGGKTLALAAALPGATVFTHDVDPARLAAAEPRIRRSRAENIRFLKPADGAEGFDLVLVDAPCSSTGTLRRTPETAWRWNLSDIQRFSLRQREILESASARVRPGGLLVYGTCSLLAPENQGVVEGFLSAHGEFSPEPLPGLDRAFSGVPGAGRGMARLPLHLGGYAGDGYFVARMRRRS